MKATEDEEDGPNKMMTTAFVEQAMACPRSAKHWGLRGMVHYHGPAV